MLSRAERLVELCAANLQATTAGRVERAEPPTGAQVDTPRRTAAVPEERPHIGALVAIDIDLELTHPVEAYEAVPPVFSGTETAALEVQAT